MSPYVGLDAHLLWLVPDVFIFELLQHKAITGDYLIMTGSDRDVLQAVFAPMAMRRIVQDINFEGGKFPPYATEGNACGGENRKFAISNRQP